MSEIVSIAQADQFIAGHSAYECGFYAVSMCTSIAPYGQPPTKSPGQISDQAQQWYAQYNGSNSSSNMDGMSLEQEYSLLRQVGLHYQALPCTDAAIEDALKRDHVVLVAIAETSVYDTALGRNPYPWTPSGNHCVVITGIASASTFYVRDSANIAPPNSLRPGPRTYDRSKLVYVSATEIGVQPLTQVPLGWHDDGKTLIAKNGVPVRDGFRLYVLNHTWNPDNVPLKPEFTFAQLELSNPGLGGGSQQPFEWIVLEWTSVRGVFEMYTGQELVKCYQVIADLKAQVAALLSQPAPVSEPDPHIEQVKSFLSASIAGSQSLLSTLG